MYIDEICRNQYYNIKQTADISLVSLFQFQKNESPRVNYFYLYRVIVDIHK